MTKGIIFDIKRYAVHDGPGIRTAVFFKGCPLHCSWCHNPEGHASAIEVLFRENRCIRCGACIAVCKHDALLWDTRGKPAVTSQKCVRCGACTEVCYAQARQRVGRELTVAQVVTEIERDIAFYDESGGGVTLSGGEPLLQEDFALELLQTCGEKEIHTAVDTCGFASWETVDRIRLYTDLFLYDLKLMDNAHHRRFTGVSNDMILSNLLMLSQLGCAIILRVPLVHGINDDNENIRRIGEFAASLPHIRGVDLLPYHHLGVDKYVRLNKVYSLPGILPPSPDRMAEIAHFLGTFGLSVRTGG